MSYKGLNTQSFAEMASKVHNNNYSYTNSIFRGHLVPVSIDCKLHGEFFQSPANHLRGQGCPYCKNKTEGIILKFLRDNNIAFTHNKRFDGCIALKRTCLFDFYLKDYNCVVELDGDIHIEEFDILARDIQKMKFLESQKIRCIRILQVDVVSNKYDWKSELLQNITSSSNLMVFMDKFDEYKYHKKYISKELPLTLIGKTHIELVEILINKGLVNK